MPDLIIDFIRQNEWANLALIEECRGLDDEQLDATAPGVYGSLRATWAHIMSAELHYASMLGQDPGMSFDDDNDPWPGWDALAAMTVAASRALEAAARQPTDRMLRTSSGRYDVEAAVLLIQAFHHGTDHRSQINTLLTSLGFEPPEMSAWDWAEATGRMRKA